MLILSISGKLVHYWYTSTPGSVQQIQYSTPGTLVHHRKTGKLEQKNTGTQEHHRNTIAWFAQVCKFATGFGRFVEKNSNFEQKTGSSQLFNQTWQRGPGIEWLLTQYSTQDRRRPSVYLYTNSLLIKKLLGVIIRILKLCKLFPISTDKASE